MRISDWSSDVCSSDLAITLADDNAFVGLHALTRTFDNVYIEDNGIARAKYGFGFAAGKERDVFLFNSFNQVHREHRSEEPRGGKEFVSTCSSGWSRYTYKKKKL